MKCRVCGREIGDEEQFCKYCGSEQKRKRKRLTWGERKRKNEARRPFARYSSTAPKSIIARRSR